MSSVRTDTFTSQDFALCLQDSQKRREKKTEEANLITTVEEFFKGKIENLAHREINGRECLTFCCEFLKTKLPVTFDFFTENKELVLKLRNKFLECLKAHGCISSFEFITLNDPFLKAYDSFLSEKWKEAMAQSFLDMNFGNSLQTPSLESWLNAFFEGIQYFHPHTSAAHVEAFCNEILTAIELCLQRADEENSRAVLARIRQAPPAEWQLASQGFTQTLPILETNKLKAEIHASFEKRVESNYFLDKL